MQLILHRLDYTRPWSHPDVYLFTGNPIRRTDGAIVMGRGAARSVRDTYPGVDRALGTAIATHPDRHIVWTVIAPRQTLGWFKVKHHWGDPGDLALIARSTEDLCRYAIGHGDLTFHMNFPGIGNGRLPVPAVLSIIRDLPDNVRIYR